jgi:hypothetical protein
MRRTLAVMAGTLVALLALALPAQAKGAGGEISITKSGGGGTGGPGGGSGGGGGTGGGGNLNLPITISGEQSFMWFDATGMGQTKFGPPDVQLGPAYDVIATLDCGKGPGVIRQKLYPYADGGPQVYTPGGQTYCGEMPLRAGWWAAPQDLLTVLEQNGLEPRAELEPAAPGAAGRRTTAASSSSPVVPIGAAVAVLLAMLVTGAVIHRRRSAAVA